MGLKSYWHGCQACPGEGFFVPVEVIRPFLKASHL
jgi:hypothetical protein